MEPSTPQTLADAADAARRIESRFPELIARAGSLDIAAADRRIQALENAGPKLGSKALERAFRALDPSGSLTIKCHYATGNQGKWDYEICADEALRLHFERIARIAGSATDSAADSLTVWLDTLREYSIEYDDRVVSDPEGIQAAHVFGRIPNACAESANLCVRLSIASFEQKRHEAPATFSPSSKPRVAKARKRAKDNEQEMYRQELRKEVRGMRSAKLSQYEMCGRLDNLKFPRPRPMPWHTLSWKQAFRDKKYCQSVKTCLSRAGKP
jgi:hypothetical protein